MPISPPKIECGVCRPVSGLRELVDSDDAADPDVHPLKLGVGKVCRLISHVRENMTRTPGAAPVHRCFAVVEAAQDLIPASTGCPP